MKNIKRLALLSLSLFSLISTNVSYAKENSKEENISDYILEPMPSWYSERFTRGHLDISKMLKNGYTRLEAVEVQNQMKDLLDSNPVFQELENNNEAYSMFKSKDPYVLQALKMAIKSVKENKYIESGFKLEPLKDDEFYVAFDLDETLLVQWYESGEKGSKYYDIKTNVQDNILKPTLKSPTYVSLTPGFEKALKDIASIPNNKGIIFFSAKLDTATYAIIDSMKIDGKPMRTFLKGVFTRNHLIRDQEPPKLSKDLRIIDETLKHIIIIDDNPSRILDKQKKNLKEIPKYNPDEYMKAKETGNKSISDYYEKVLPTIVNEIKESAEYARKNKTSFVEAYYPYTMDSSAELLMYITQGLTYKEAISRVRKDHKLFEPKFYFYEDK
ncbi:MAG: NIF family HAD-type phosphatase [Candidatus Sericytochromatia bacterium]